MTDLSQVVISVPRAKKGAGVAASRKQGRKLTDWPDALAALMRISADTPRGRALRAVLCDGVSVASAARDQGIAHPAVYRAAAEARRVMQLAAVVTASSRRSRGQALP